MGLDMKAPQEETTALCNSTREKYNRNERKGRRENCSKT